MRSSHMAIKGRGNTVECCYGNQRRKQFKKDEGGGFVECCQDPWRVGLKGLSKNVPGIPAPSNSFSEGFCSSLWPVH